jgi:hypothetical protein
MPYNTTLETQGCESRRLSSPRQHKILSEARVSIWTPSNTGNKKAIVAMTIGPSRNKIQNQEVRSREARYNMILRDAERRNTHRPDDDKWFQKNILLGDHELASGDWREGEVLFPL